MENEYYVSGMCDNRHTLVRTLRIVTINDSFKFLDYGFFNT